jgi:hypothetical protein
MEKIAATVIINRACDMTPKGRKEIAEFIRRQADDLEKFGDQYSKRLTARCYYESEEDQ